MRDRKQVLEGILECGVVAVVRAESADQAFRAIEAAAAGGVHAVEVTFTVPGALEIIREVASRAGDDLILGAGTVLTPETAVKAIEAGARYIVSPNTSTATIQAAKANGAAVFPGAFTPTEVITAWQSGADIIKLFPANVVGPSYIKDLHGPFPEIPIMPTGGVDLSTAQSWLEGGAVALGVGGALIDKKLMAAGNYAEITERAKRFIDIIRTYRSGR